jgi:hypothetical protein
MYDTILEKGPDGQIFRLRMLIRVGQRSGGGGMESGCLVGTGGNKGLMMRMWYPIEKIL